MKKYNKMPDPPTRKCIVCNKDIKQCMGFCLGRDIIKALENPKETTRIREICGLCIDFVDPTNIIDHNGNVVV